MEEQMDKQPLAGTARAFKGLHSEAAPSSITKLQRVFQSIFGTVWPQLQD